MQRVPSDPEDMDMISGEEVDPPSPHTPPRWDITAVVRRKMVFAKRPMPMVGKTATALGEAVKSR